MLCAALSEEAVNDNNIVIENALKKWSGDTYRIRGILTESRNQLEIVSGMKNVKSIS